MLAPQMCDLETRVESFREHGYVLLPGLLGAAAVASLRVVLPQERNDAPVAVAGGGNLLGRYPDIFLPLAASPAVLDIAEAVMGPFVQLDSLSLVSMPAGSCADISWHRDPHGSVPRGTDFQRPLAINVLVYLQDLVSETGPLRVIPGSHRRPLTMAADERKAPHPEERLLQPRAGDAVLIHNNLVHSRSRNRAPAARLHVSMVYTLTCMRSGLNGSGATLELIQKLLADAGSPRLNRLFGRDDLGDDRHNSGFMRPDEEMWEQWRQSEATVHGRVA